MKKIFAFFTEHIKHAKLFSLEMPIICQVSGRRSEKFKKICQETFPISANWHLNKLKTIKRNNVFFKENVGCVNLKLRF